MYIYLQKDKMTKAELHKDYIDASYEYECPSIRDRGISYSSSDDEDFSSAMNYCSEKNEDTRFKEYYATAPNNADKLGVGTSSPDIRRNSIGFITPSFQTDSFDLTCRSLPDNNRYRNHSLFSNDLKVLNKVGPNYKIQKNVDSASSNKRRLISSNGTYNTPYQSSLKGERIHSTISTGSRASMHFSRHF